MITERHLVRHFDGVTTARDAAILDIAQDHLLFLLHQEGWFEQGLVFNGGTALRKYRAQQRPVFDRSRLRSPDPDLALNVLNAVDGASVAGFAFAVRQLGNDGRRADIQVDTPRRLWMLKVYRDVVHDERGNKPLNAEQVLREGKSDQDRRRNPHQSHRWSKIIVHATLEVLRVDTTADAT